MREPMTIYEEGMKLSRAYIWRQYWKMKWITLVVVGAMSSFTIITRQWVPLLEFDMVAFTVSVIAIAFLQMKMSEKFAIHVKHQRTNTDTPKSLYTDILSFSWVMILLTWLLMYWTVMIIFITSIVGTT